MEPDVERKESALSDFVAYVDLGSGSLIVQLVIASIVAIPFFIRTQIRQVLGTLRSRFGLAGSPPRDGSNPG